MVYHYVTNATPDVQVPNNMQNPGMFQFSPQKLCSVAEQVTWGIHIPSLSRRSSAHKRVENLTCVALHSDLTEIEVILYQSKLF